MRLLAATQGLTHQNVRFVLTRCAVVAVVILARCHSGVVDYAEAASGLTVLCGGDRDDKIGAAFALVRLLGSSVCVSAANNKPSLTHGASAVTVRH